MIIFVLLLFDFYVIKLFLNKFTKQFSFAQKQDRQHL